MKKNRRNFLKRTDLAGIGFTGAGILPTYGTKMVSQLSLSLEPDDTFQLIYSDIAESEEYNWSLPSFLSGVLKTFDVPDCYHSLAAKNLRQIDPWNAAT